jgi:CheY-like chemotaxis protein
VWGAGFISPFEITQTDTLIKINLTTKTDAHDVNQLQGANILLVEDNEINQELVIYNLESKGINVTVADNGQEALEILKEITFDGILMDCQMPVMDGYEATKEIRKQERFKNLPVIAITANVLPEDRKKILKCGMNDLIGKPFKPDELFNTMAKFIKPEQPLQPCIVEKNLSQENELNETDDFPELPGIDISIGLFNSKNRTQLYCKLLKMFRDNQKDFETNFRLAQSGNDPKEAERMSHTLKGLAGTIGAMKLHEAAKALEMGCRENVDDIENSLERVISELEPVISGLETIESHLSDNDPAKKCDIDKTRINELMNELYLYLSDYDTNANKVMNSLLPLMTLTEHAEEFDKIANAVEMLDFELAMELLEKFDNPLWSLSIT